MANFRESAALGLTKALLMALGAGAVIGVALLFPGAGWIYREFKKEQWEKAKKRGQLLSAIKRLEKQELVSWAEKDGEVALTLTESGKKKTLQYNIDTMKIKKPDKWDGLWRVIVFDIPEDMRLARNMFRDKLKDWGFYRLQKSVFIYPFECKDEIDFLRHNLEITPHVQYILAKEIPGVEVKASNF